MLKDPVGNSPRLLSGADDRVDAVGEPAHLREAAEEDEGGGREEARLQRLQGSLSMFSCPPSTQPTVRRATT